MRLEHVLFASAAVAGSLFTSAAFADAVPPPTIPCQTSVLGSECNMVDTSGYPTGAKGVCTETVCPVTNYADAAVGLVACVKCLWPVPVVDAGADVAAEDAGADATAEDASADAGAVDATASIDAADEAAVTVPANDAAADTYVAVTPTPATDAATEAGPATGSAGSTGNAEPAASDDSGCSVSQNGARAFGPWMLAGATSLLLLLKRRRRS
jgi:hypothetical protein